MLLIVQRALHGSVQSARNQVPFNPAIDRSRSCVLIEPQPQFFQLLLRQRPNHPCNLFNPFCAHIQRPLTILVRQSTNITSSRLASASLAIYVAQPDLTQTPFSTTKFLRIPSPLINLRPMHTPFESLLHKK